MQIYDPSMEERCILTLTSPEIPENVRSSLLGKLNKEYFHYPPCLAAFNRIDAIAKKRMMLTDFDDLVSDPALSEDFRDVLRESSEKRATNKKKLETMLDTLDTYRKVRIVYNMCNKALEKVEAEDIDIDKLLDDLAQNLARAQKHIGEEDQFVNIGKNNNADKVVQDAIHRVTQNLVKTGFTEYDKENGGLPEEGVMLIAATTSGGKSVMLMVLLVRLYLHSNRDIMSFSFEMNEVQEMQRLLCHLTGIPFFKIKQNKTSKQEKQQMQEAYEKFRQHGIKNECTFSRLSPTRGMTIDDVFRVAKPFKASTLGIDYVSLLDGVDEDNQWKVLSAIIRKAKTYSRTTKSLVIILVQLDADTNNIRYARGMKEHADVVWQWNYSKKEQRELKILPVDASKVRDGSLMSFQLGERFDIMNIENMSGGDNFGDDMNESEEEDLTPKKKKKSQPNVDEDDDVPKKKGKKKKKGKSKLDQDEGEGDSYALS